MKLVKNTNYKELTRKELNKHVPSLVMFGDDDAPLRDVVADVYNMFRIHEDYLNRGELSEFNSFNHIKNYEEYELEVGKAKAVSNHTDFITTFTLLSVIPYAKAYGVNAYEKTANLLFNIKLFTSPLQSIYFDSFELNFVGYKSIKEIKDDVKDILNLHDRDIKSDNYTYLSANIRSCLCDLDASHKEVLMDNPMREVKINAVTFPFNKVLSNYKEVMDKLTNSSVNKVKTVKDRTSDTTISVRVTSPSQLKSLRKRDLLDKDLIEKFAKGKLVTRERVSYINNKTINIVALDNSGSMNNSLKQTHVKAILAQLLSKVVEGEAEVQLMPYTYGIDSVHTATDKKSARAVYKWIEANRPPGNGTDIAKSIQFMVDKAVSTNLSEPSVTIILDGDDVLDASMVETKGVKINAILLGKTNAGILEITKNTGGFCIVENLYAQNLK